MDDANREKACSITEAWGLSDQQRKQLLDHADAGSQVVMIHDSLHRFFGDRQQTDSWNKKPNRAFEGRSALDVMLAGDLERVWEQLSS